MTVSAQVEAGSAGPAAAVGVEAGSAAPAAQAAATTRDVSVAFPSSKGRVTTALEGVTLTLGAGEFTAILGPSGCGKSTLLRAVGGLLPASVVRGEVDVMRRPDGSRATAWMPQRDGLLPWRRAMSNAMVGAIASGVPREEARVKARELFTQFGLAGFEGAWPHELSGGMRQRLALLRTCLADRPMLLLDEPFGALDPLTRRTMNDWLAGLNLTHGDEPRTVVLVTHDVDEAIALADRIVVMSGRPGRVVHDTRACGDDRFDRAALLGELGL